MSAEPTTIRLPRPPDFITSDTHLGHANILDYCPARRSWTRGDQVELGRTYSGAVDSIYLHDEAIIQRWVDTVRPGDIVLHLGDFAFGSREQVAAYVARLPGTLVLVVGNHDRTMNSMRDAGVHQVARRAEFTHPQLGRVVCRHRPKDFTAEDATADVLLHGHCHGDHHRLAEGTGAAHHDQLYDVGVDVFGPGPCRMHVVASAIITDNPGFQP